MVSALVKVGSGVPPGTDLGALIFLTMCSLRSDSPLTIFCFTKLWIVRKLQGDLRELDLWADKWQMAFNMKCHRLTIRKDTNDVNTTHTHTEGNKPRRSLEAGCKCRRLKLFCESLTRSAVLPIPLHLNVPDNG